MVVGADETNFRPLPLPGLDLDGLPFEQILADTFRVKRARFDLLLGVRVVRILEPQAADLPGGELPRLPRPVLKKNVILVLYKLEFW